MAQKSGISLTTSLPKKDKAKGEGVAVLSKKGIIRNVMPSLQQLWEHNTAAVIVHAKEKGKAPVKLALFSFYSPPHKKALADARLKLLVTSIKEIHADIQVIVCGDYNRRLAAVEKLAELCNV